MASDPFEIPSCVESEPSARPIELSLIIPTYNERENIPPLLVALERVLAEISWEAVFVDDSSPDGTAEFIRSIAATDRRIRVLERIHRRGLSSACIEGMLAAPAPYIAVLDADLQHDERILPEMLARMKSGNLDLVVGSRNIVGGSMCTLPRGRIWLSQLGARIGRLVCRCRISDPMSGFWMVQRTFFQLVMYRLTGTGFKLLLDLIASSPRTVRIEEVPYHFRTRRSGESKLDLKIELEYIYLLVDKIMGNRIPIRFVLFVLVGSLGLVIHLSVLVLLYHGATLSFVASQVAATISAMIFNFWLNNVATFRDRRLQGWRFVEGLFTFCIACSVGALVNVSFAKLLTQSGIAWPLAGICGMAISSVWNYGVNTILTWHRSRSWGAIKN